MDLSVIIPCRDVAGTLVEQLDALAAERWTGTWEVLVVDNGSADATASVAAAHLGLADRLRVVTARARSGVAYARNQGVLASDACAVAFCDGDDVVAPGWVAAMGDALAAHPLVTGSVELEQLNAPEIAGSRGRRPADRPPTFGGITFLRGNNGGMQRDVWERLAGFDEEFVGLEDIELSLRAAAVGLRVHHEPRAVVHYRYRADLGGVWRQGLAYGRSYPQLVRRARRLGLAAPGRGATWRSWAWLALNVPRLFRADVRWRWVWTLANRLGSLEAVLRHG
jgi:glycosyltransferase involved in cell wall biosynthesis